MVWPPWLGQAGTQQRNCRATNLGVVLQGAQIASLTMQGHAKQTDHRASKVVCWLQLRYM